MYYIIIEYPEQLQQQLIKSGVEWFDLEACDLLLQISEEWNPIEFDAEEIGETFDVAIYWSLWHNYELKKRYNIDLNRDEIDDFLDCFTTWRTNGDIIVFNKKELEYNMKWLEYHR